MPKAIVVVFVLVLAAVGAYLVAGRGGGPAVTIVRPAALVGASSAFEVVAGAPRNALSSLRVAIEQNGRATTLFDLTTPPAAAAVFDGGGRTRVTWLAGGASVPGLTSGPARVVVTAARRVLFGLRTLETRVAQDVRVRLEPPRVSALSRHHYVNLGGSEAIVYRVDPADVESGVRVGDLEYPGYPVAGVSVEGISAIADPAVRIAFFALRWDQALDAPMSLYVRDEAGNSAEAPFDHRTFPKPQKNSRIPLDDAFLERVVPAISASTTDVTPAGSLIEKFLVLNGDLRRKNAAFIASFAPKSSRDMLWRGVVFHPFTNSKAESAFADHRTYVYQGRDVDAQVHLGFDLASYANTPIVAANRGTVLFAGMLGIYGNAVIIDHGLGVQSLYGHLSSIDVKPGASVEKGQTLGKSGMTGMAGGDHLHFTMLVNGQTVTPVEWWDAHWIEDRVLRKLRELN